MRITEANRRWWTLAGACMALFVLMLDSTVVTLALPSIRRDLGASASELQWVVNGYLLTIAVLVVSVGRLGDMFGRRRVFLAGVITFTLGLVIAATAPTIEVLIVARFVQGIGAAGMLTLSLALVSSVFDDASRPRALGIWAGVSASALAIGPVVGGALVDALSWRWVFWIGVAPLVLGLWWTLAAAPESRDEGASHRIDVAGLVALSVGLAAIVLVLIEGHDWGWDSTRSLVVLTVGVVALVAFVAIEPRVRQPIVEFGLFANKPYLGASAAAFCLVGAWWTVIFYMPTYLQGPLGYRPALSGVLVLPITAPMMVISPLVPRLTARFGLRALITTGLVLGAVGVALMSRLDDSSGYLPLLPGFLLLGIALGLVYSPVAIAAMEAMPRAKAGIAGGVLAMNRVLAGTVLLAVTGAIVSALRDAHPVAYSLGHALWASVALCVVGAVLAFWLVPRSAGEAASAPTTTTATRRRPDRDSRATPRWRRRSGTRRELD